MTDSEDLGHFSVLSLDPPEIPCEEYKVLNEEDVSNSLTEFNSVERKQKSSLIDDTQLAKAVKELEINDSPKVGLDKPSVEKGLDKCASFPFSAASKCVSEGVKGDSTVGDLKREGCARSVSLPTLLKPISALKGSREKLGAPPRNLSVKWAPDVYDPIPTSVSHVPRQKPQRYRNDKRNGKNKQKAGGKTSPRGKGKDKKQSRKSGGSSNKSYRLSDNEIGEAWSVVPESNARDFAAACQPDDFVGSQSRGDSSGGTHGSALDYGVNSPDPFCGHSFLKKSVAPMHFSVTQAT